MGLKYYIIENKYNEKDLVLVNQDVPFDIDVFKTKDDWTDKGVSLKSIIQKTSDLIFYTKHKNITDYPVSEYGYEVVSEKLKMVFDRFIKDEIEFFEVEFNTNTKIKEKYYLINFISVKPVIDSEKSDYSKLSNGDILEINKLIVDYSKLKNQIAFRMEEKKHVLIINENLKKAIEDAGITGVKFRDLEDYQFPNI